MSNPKPSFSLLNQNEIDTLVTFLSDKANYVTSDVLNQESVDKLLQLLKHKDLNKVSLSLLDSIEITPPDILIDLNIRSDSTEICELLFDIDETTSFITLTAKNVETGASYTITPATLDRIEVLEDASIWGNCIPPVLFTRIAKIFSLKYSRETYKKVCSLYALKTTGSENCKLSSIYYPTTDDLLNCLL